MSQEWRISLKNVADLTVVVAMSGDDEGNEGSTNQCWQSHSVAGADPAPGAALMSQADLLR